jgi:hypothetical protein
MYLIWADLTVLNLEVGEIQSEQPSTEGVMTVGGSMKSTHSTPRSEARGMLRVDTERRFLPRFKNRGLAPSNVSRRGICE